jgi:hypothetical protein
MTAAIIHRAGFHQEFWGDLSQRDCCKNADFIAHARTDIPALLDHIAKLQGELAAANNRIKELKNGNIS